jgi:hypothetical protein
MDVDVRLQKLKGVTVHRIINNWHTYFIRRTGLNHMVTGNLETLSSLQLSSDLEGMDVVSKDILKNKEVFAYRCGTTEEL